MAMRFRDVRCDGEFKRPGLGGKCNQKLFATIEDLVEIKCPRCKQIKVIHVDSVVMATS